MNRSLNYHIRAHLTREFYFEMSIDPSLIFTETPLSLDILTTHLLRKIVYEVGEGPYPLDVTKEYVLLCNSRSHGAFVLGPGAVGHRTLEKSMFRKIREEESGTVLTRLDGWLWLKDALRPKCYKIGCGKSSTNKYTVEYNLEKFDPILKKGSEIFTCGKHGAELYMRVMRDKEITYYLSGRPPLTQLD